MRSTPAACLLLLLAAPGLHAEPGQLSTAQTAAAAVLWGDAVPAAQHTEIQRVTLEDGTFVERLRGEAAMAHLYNVQSRRPGAFAAARKALEGRGFTQTATVYVERTIRLARNPTNGNGSRAVPAQTYSEQNGDGEIIFWSWDDGRNATWEGAIYVEAYSTGAASTWEGQIDASTTEHPWVYARKTWEGPGGGPLPTSFGGAPPRPGSFVPALMSGKADASGYALAHFRGWAWCWRACVVTGCGTAAVGCLATGPGWPPCFAAWCIGAEIACAMGCVL